MKPAITEAAKNAHVKVLPILARLFIERILSVYHSIKAIQLHQIFIILLEFHKKYIYIYY